MIEYLILFFTSLKAPNGSQWDLNFYGTYFTKIKLICAKILFTKEIHITLRSLSDVRAGCLLERIISVLIREKIWRQPNKLEKGYGLPP